MRDVTFGPENERFSLDDPEAGRKLAANLDARKVRLAFSELCRHFGCDDLEDKLRLRALLETLKADGTLVEPEVKLFCRPALARGATGAARRKAVAKAKRHFRRVKDVSLRDAQVASLLAFIRERGEAPVSAMKEEAARLAFPDGRLNYLIQHMRETSKIERVSYGTYRLAPEPAEPPSAPVP